jgi:hypothetical protein
MTTREKYTDYCITIEGHDPKRCHSHTIPGNASISKCVEKFLRDFLKNDKIKVKIEAHETEVKEV